MKVKLKGGSSEMNARIEAFFSENIRPILGIIAFEGSDDVIRVHEKADSGEYRETVDPTAEVIVELSMEAINLAMDLDCPLEKLREASGDFYDEALAIRRLQETDLFFSIENRNCRYKPATK